LRGQSFNMQHQSFHNRQYRSFRNIDHNKHHWSSNSHRLKCEITVSTYPKAVDLFWSVTLCFIIQQAPPWFHGQSMCSIDHFTSPTAHTPSNPATLIIRQQPPFNVQPLRKIGPLTSSNSHAQQLPLRSNHGACSCICQVNWSRPQMPC